MKKENFSTFDVITMMREFGNVKVSKIKPNGFWCAFADLAETESLTHLISKVQAKHGKVVNSISGHRDVSTYYSTNSNL